MIKVAVALAFLVVVSAAVIPREDDKMFFFMKFIREHNREYSSLEEFHSRFDIFKANLEKVDNTERFSRFMDHTEEEFRGLLNLDVAAIAEFKSKMERYTMKKPDAETPTSFDWRDHGAVADVKDQGQCGSCWAFSAVANIEGQYAIKNGELLTFSEQELVDCDSNDAGCGGGWMDRAFEYLQQNGGLETDADYAYTATGGSCQFDESKAKVQIAGFKDIGQNEDEIARVLVENGPLSIAVNANPFMFYSGGILRPTTSSCDPTGLNHGVTLVGFGEENGVKFWIIRNSWGSGWGEDGYIRLERGTGACGCNTAVSTAQIN